MRPNQIVSALILSTLGALTTAACSGETVAVGKTGSSDQELKKTKTGEPTGNGKTCSWESTALLETVVADNGATSATAPVPTYALNDEFKSIDGCNECACTAQGIMCTVRACQIDPGTGGEEPCPALAKICPDGSTAAPAKVGCGFAPCPGEVACTSDAKKCSDGSYVGRVAPTCAFASCPGEQVACDDDAKVCPDGSSVGRVRPGCEFAACPTTPVACTADAMKCPDGSYVGRTGPSCEFKPCPSK